MGGSSAWCADARAGRGPLRRGDERGGRRGAARRGWLRRGRQDRSPTAGSRPRGRRGRAGGAHPGGDPRPGPRGPASRARALPPPFPAVLRALLARRLDRHPRRRPLRHPPHPHRRSRRVGAGDHPCGRLETRRLPGSGAGPSPDRLVLGSEGTLGVITEAWVRLRQRPTPTSGPAGSRSTGSRRRRGGPEWRSGAFTRPTAGCSTRREAAVSFLGPSGGALMVLGFESAGHPVDEQLNIALEGRRAATAGRRERWAAARGTSATARAGSLPANPAVPGRGADRGLVAPWFLAAPYLRDSLRLASACSATRSRRRSRGGASTASRRGLMPLAVGCRRVRPATDGPCSPRGSPAASRTSSRTARRPTSPSSPPPGAATSWPNGTRSRPRLRTPSSPRAGPSPTTMRSAAITGPGMTASAPTPSRRHFGARSGRSTPAGYSTRACS